MLNEQVIHWAMTIVMAAASTIFWFWARSHDERAGETNRRFLEIQADVDAIAQKVHNGVGMPDQLRLEIARAASEAKHQAINAVAGQIAELSLRKVDEHLHREQIADLRRRVRVLEGRNRRSDDDDGLDN